MSDWNPSVSDVLGMEWFPAQSGSIMLDGKLRSAAFSFDQANSQDIGAIQIPNVALPARGGVYAIEVYDDEDAVAENVTLAGATPNQDVSLGTWTDEAGATSSIYTHIDEGVPFTTGDSIKMSGSTSRYTSRVNTGSLSLTGKRILGVELRYGATIGPTGVLRGGLNLSGSDYYGPIQLGPATLRTAVYLWTVNPSTGKNWTIAEVQALDTTDEWFVEGSTVASVWSAVVVYGAVIRVYYCDENRLAVGYLDDRASGLTEGTASSPAWNSATMTTPTGGTWTKDGSGRHLYIVRRVSDTGVMSVPYLDAGTLGAPPIGSGWTPTLDASYGHVSAMGDATTRAIPILQRTTAPADSTDSQTYAVPVNALVYDTTVAEQELSGAAADDYSILRFLVKPGSTDPGGALSVKVKKRSDSSQLGSTYTVTVAEARTFSEVAPGWYLIQAQLVTPATLAGATQYYLEFSSASSTSAAPWTVRALDTGNNGNAATYDGTTDRASVNGSEADRYDLAATLSLPPTAPTLDSLVVVDNALQVGTGTVCADEATQLFRFTWDETLLGSAFVRYEIERSDGFGVWHRIAHIGEETAATFDDDEARRGRPQYYRVRVVRSDGAFSEWTETTDDTVMTSASSPTLWLTSNYGAAIGDTHASMAFDFDPEVDWSFLEDNERADMAVYLRDYSIGFNPTEWRGVDIHYTLIIAFNGRDIPTIGDVSGVTDLEQATGLGAGAFYWLRRFAAARWPYVCLLDHEGNRHFVHLRVPSGSKTGGPNRYLAGISGREVLHPNEPVVVVYDSSNLVFAL